MGTDVAGSAHDFRAFGHLSHTISRPSTGCVDGNWGWPHDFEHRLAVMELDAIIYEKIRCFGWFDYCNQIRILCWIFVLGDQAKLDTGALAHGRRCHLCAYKPYAGLAFAKR